MTFVFVDRLVEHLENEVARFTKCCSLTEDFYMQHFPGSPIFPGALMLESFVQAATLFLAAGSGFERWPIVRGVSGARFLGFVQPGDTVLLEVRRSGESGVSAQAAVDGRRVATAKLEFDLVAPEGEHAPFRPSLDAARGFLAMLGAERA